MGIRYLNTYIKNNCSHGLSNVNIRNLAGHSLAIDTSIYMYKFLGQNKLIENFYLMISILLYYKITPIFIFDGKPPPEKIDILKQRRQNKKVTDIS